MTAMNEVSRETFYRVIGPQNVTPSPQGNWPYTSLFKTPAGVVAGSIEQYLPEGSAMPSSRYLLTPTTGDQQ